MWEKFRLFVFIALTGIMGLSCGRKEIPLKPALKIPPGLTPWSFQASLIIPPETRDFLYWSPNPSQSGPLAAADTLQPFTLPVGRAFSAAAHEVFSQLFQGVTVENQMTAAVGDRLVVIESHLEEFSLVIEYVSLSPQPHDTFLDIKGKIKARFRFNRPGKNSWENRVVSHIPATRIILNPWAGEEIGKLAAEAMASLFEKILMEGVEKTEKPNIPLHFWLTK